MTILDQPIRVDHEAERISVFNGGASLDVNGNEQLRREAMRFYEQWPRAARLLQRIAEDKRTPVELVASAEAVLRDAGVLP